jgi:hypothetical protein
MRHTDELWRRLRKIGNRDAAILAAEHLLDVSHAYRDDEVAGRAAEPHQVVVPWQRASFHCAEIRKTAHIRRRYALRES